MTYEVSVLEDKVEVRQGHLGVGFYSLSLMHTVVTPGICMHFNIDSFHYY